MGWTFFYLMVALKILPIAGNRDHLVGGHAEPDPLEGRDDGGNSCVPEAHPRRARRPRRGPHGEPATRPPPRAHAHGTGAHPRPLAGRRLSSSTSSAMSRAPRPCGAA